MNLKQKSDSYMIVLSGFAARHARRKGYKRGTEFVYKNRVFVMVSNTKAEPYSYAASEASA